MPLQDASWNADCYRIGWHIFDHYGIGANHYVITDVDAAENLGASSNVDSITDDGGSADTGTPQSDRYSITNNYVVAEDSITADDDLQYFQGVCLFFHERETTARFLPDL